MQKIHVLIVDDSVVIRRLLSDILGQDPHIEVVGTAPNGKIALSKLPQLNPDVVTLDIEMPELDGLSTLPLLRKDYPRLPVIMFSTLTERGAASTFEALARGATDYVAKPANVGSIADAMEAVRVQLIPKIRSLCPRFSTVANENQQADLIAPPKKVTTLRPGSRSQRCDAIVIGASTGGPQALAAVLNRLPENLPVPVVVVQHMPPVFTRHLATRLNQGCGLEVREAEAGDVLRPGLVLIAPGDVHLEVRRKGASVESVLTHSPHENSCRPAVDVLFRSAARVFGPALQAVVLTGMGQDGKRGAEAVVQAGGFVIAQDERTSVVWGMPRAISEAGLANKVIPVDAVPVELMRCVAIGRPLALTSEGTI